MEGLAAIGGGWRQGTVEIPGGTVRTGEWLPDGPARGTCVLVTGRSEFLEKYAEQAADWAARGWRVVSWDWPGQGLSSRALANPQKGHIRDFGEYLDAAEAVLRAHDIGMDGRPVICFAHSMGAHVMTRFVAERPHPFRALILSAAMLGIETGPFPEWLVPALARAGAALGLAERYAPGQIDYREEAHRFEGNVLTSDPRRFRVYIEAYRNNPCLILGGATFGWLDAAYRSIRALWRAPLERVDIPVLILSAGGDRVVRSALHARLARRLPDAVHKTYPPAEHELMMERDEIRDRVWADVDAFLAERVGH
ncbi:MAG TPA: alpha/beta hydrolase [Azospirillaceae bacterium]|nr:alpha/beta hydrolase [Azospirillaceae bacterium]